MDLRLFFAVVWRFRVLVSAGVLAAVLLSFLSFMRVGLDGGAPSFSYRAKEEWASYARLLVTQSGFEWGEAVGNSARDRVDPNARASRVGAQRVVEDRLTSLAILYARLIDSDGVTRIMLRDGPILGKVEAAPLRALEGSDEVIPIISIAGLADTPAASHALTGRAAAALVEYIAGQQEANEISPRNRILLRPILEAGGTKLIKPRKNTVPIVVFLTVMLATVGLALILENLRPRARPVADPDAVSTPKAQQIRRSASG